MKLPAHLDAMSPDTMVSVGYLQQLPEPAGPRGAPRPLADLTVPEIAEAVGRAESTVRGWLGAGLLDGYRFRGREWRVTQEALRAFLDRQGQAPRGERDRGGDDLGAWRAYRDRDDEEAA